MKLEVRGAARPQGYRLAEEKNGTIRTSTLAPIAVGHVFGRPAKKKKARLTLKNNVLTYFAVHRIPAAPPSSRITSEEKGDPPPRLLWKQRPEFRHTPGDPCGHFMATVLALNWNPQGAPRSTFHRPAPCNGLAKRPKPARTSSRPSQSALPPRTRGSSGAPASFCGLKTPPPPSRARKLKGHSPWHARGGTVFRSLKVLPKKKNAP